ncbi:MAG: hypothetical protein OXC07_11935 [Kistimonas sp.]|nr:hypothetical protein [Kistimonas sp.]
MFSQACGTSGIHDTGASARASQPTRVPVFPAAIAVDPGKWECDVAYGAYLSQTGAWTTKGVPLPGMQEYTTECRAIERVFAYRQGEASNDFPYGDSWILSGELKDGSVFHFEAACDLSGFGGLSWGIMLLAPGWDSLFDNLSDDEIQDFVRNMGTDSSSVPEQKLMQDLHNKMENIEALRSRLKELFLAK